MKVRFVRNKAKGQAIPLIALMIVVLVALVGLSVDVGNTYAEQRNTVRSTNAAALAAMNNLLHGGDDLSVYQGIVSSLKANNIQVAAGAQPQSGERVLVANYLDASGNPLTACPNVGSNCPAAALQGVKYIRVNVSGKVDTYFARVVGRNDLPVGADAWATRSSCVNGIYPIRVRTQLLGPNGFLNPDGTYSDAYYRNKTVKIIYLHDPVHNPAGAFNWLRWTDIGTAGGTNATALEAMLVGPGNIAGNFKEADWPTSNNLNLPKPSGYPLEPGILSPGDWLFANTGVSAANGIQDALDFHIANKTVMILPITDTDTGQGNGAEYHVERLGAFLLLDYNLTGAMNGNNVGFIKLAYLGNSGECASLVTPPKRDSNLGITGQVQYRPRFREVPQSRQPVQYLFVLDTSGSMSWTYDGYGWKGNEKTLCTGVNASCSGANAWPDEKQRRIYFAKNAIRSFIGQMAANDTARIVSSNGGPISNPSNSRAIDQLTDVYPSNTWSNDPIALNQAVDDAGKAYGDIYKSEGRTPSAVGLARATQVFDQAPTKDPVSGQDYKRVVIFATDGVANIRRDGSAPTYTGSCGSEVANCNVGYENGVAKPITAMGLEADTLKQDATIYAIALAGVDETGLKEVASAPNAPFFTTSESGGDLAGIIANIVTDVKYGDCVPDGGNTWEQTMQEGQVGSVGPPQGPLSFPTVGTVYIYDQNGNLLPSGKGKAPIQVNPESGLLIYHFDDLTPGTYQMRAFVGYKGEDDISHIYDQIYNPNTALIDTSLTFTIDPSRSLGSVVPMDTLHLDMPGSVCP